MSEWFYQSKKGDIVGPVTSKELLERVRDGSIVAESLIRKDDSQWVAAESVNDLFSRAFDALREHHCPFCGKPCMAPPTTCTHCYRKVPVTEEQRAQRKEQEKREERARRKEQERERDRLVHGDVEPDEAPTRPEPTTGIGRAWRRFTDFLAVCFEREKE